MNHFAAPPPLQKGQTVFLVSPARKLNPEDIEIAVKIFKEWGLQVRLGEHLFAEAGQFAGDDAQRTADMQTALDNPEIHAIVCVRGGYGTSRILDNLDFQHFVKSPKWISGFSDITALHSHLHRLRVQSIHSTMPICFDTDNPDSIESLRKALFGEELNYKIPHHHLNRIGTGKGLTVGGNLSVFASVIGTASDVKTEGKILFLEDTDEYLYHIDRMTVQLKRSGKLKDLMGLVVGNFSKIHDNGVPFGKNVNEIIAEAVAEYDYPVCFDFPFGHSPENMALPCGREAILEVSETEVNLKFL
jgi:muramoyltetrapeptide carboxypeptidase